jgi:hypothetical protein
MYIKTSLSDDPSGILTSADAKFDIQDTDRFSYNGGAAGVGTNIDLVFIPDLMVAAVQRLLPALTNLSD